MKSSKSKSSPKKANIADISHRTMLAIEFNKQNLLQDIKNWNEQFALLESSVDKIDKACKEDAFMKPQELSKEFLSTQAKITRINKEIESFQKQSNKTQVKFETKILEPFLKGQFTQQGQTILTETKATIEKIQALLVSCEELLSPVIDKSIQAAKRLSALEDSVHKICLSDDVEEAVKINHKLNERMETICKETATSLENNAPPQYDPQKITTTFLQLYKAHQVGGKLLDQIQKNLHITDKPSTSPKDTHHSSPKFNE